MDPKMLYTLIAITYGGTVSQTPGFRSLELCQDAASLAQNGHTVVEQNQIDAIRREAEAERQQKADAECAGKPDGSVSLTSSCYKGKAMLVSYGRMTGPNEIKLARCLIEPPQSP